MALAWLATNGIESASLQLRGIALVVVVALPILMALCVATVPEAPAPTRERPPYGTWAGLVIVARNPAFLRMVFCVLLFVSGIAIQGTLHRLVLADVMGDESRFPWMILFENVATLAGVPCLARDLEDASASTARCSGQHSGSPVWSLPLIFLREGQTTVLIATIVVRGSSFASILFLSNSIAADVIDLDTLESGEQRSGLFFAVWGMVTKLSLALGVLLGTALPAAFGYEPALDATPPVIQARVMAIYGAVPALLMAAGALFLVGFPITRERHAAIRAALETR